MLHYNPDEIGIGFIEVPKEINLIIPFVGCPIHCPECHSKHNWKTEGYPEFTEDVFLNLLSKYKDKITSIVFMGGEWEMDELYKFIELAHSLLYKICLYTGLELSEIRKLINIGVLDYLKVGPYDSKFGGLDNPKTNQIMYKIDTMDGLIDITKEFRKC